MRATWLDLDQVRENRKERERERRRQRGIPTERDGERQETNTDREEKLTIHDLMS